MNTVQNFNHDSDNTFEACGLTKEGLKETLSDFTDLLDIHRKVEKDIPKLSEIAAMVESVMTKRELSFFYAQNMMSEFERYLEVEALKGLMGDSESED